MISKIKKFIIQRSRISMKNKFIIPIIIIIIFSVVLVSGCITSDISNINAQADNVNTHVKSGDHYYNLSASDANSLSLTKAASEVNDSNNDYTQALTAAQSAYNYAQNSNDAIYVQYTQNIQTSIEYKLNATLELKTAINLLKNNNTAEANTHLTTANDYMNKSLTYDNNSQNILKQNPSKFKQ